MNIFIFHRDLRLYDNTTLIEMVTKENNALPIFIFPPEQIEPSKNKYFSNNSVQFMIESLKELNKQLKKFNSRIYFLKGLMIKLLKKL